VAKRCDIRASISNWFALTSAVQEGVLTRSMTMEGHIDDYVEGGEPADTRFHRRGIKLFLSAPRDEDWAAGIGQLEGIAHVCGVALIEAGVIPKTYEFDGVIEDDQPVQIRFKLSVEAFNAIQQQAYDAERRGHLLEMKATLSGNSLPDTGDRFGSVLLKELDVSERRQFAVTAVSFRETNE
jgi:hypothetical protein